MVRQDRYRVYIEYLSSGDNEAELVKFRANRDSRNDEEREWAERVKRETYVFAKNFPEGTVTQSILVMPLERI